ncbi:MAG: hypothetical protein JWP89_4854 [Schlesneria sp.]|nr:hypothetical protein [Schlesneria sp.]
MSNRSTRRKRYRTEAQIKASKATQRLQEAAAGSPSSLGLGDGVSGLTSIQEARLLSRALAWQDPTLRYPTDVPVDQIALSAKAENRSLTTSERLVLSAAAILDRDLAENGVPKSSRDHFRDQSAKLICCRLILRMERANQKIDDSIWRTEMLDQSRSEIH